MERRHDERSGARAFASGSRIMAREGVRNWTDRRDMAGVGYPIHAAPHPVHRPLIARYAQAPNGLRPADSGRHSARTSIRSCRTVLPVLGFSRFRPVAGIYQAPPNTGISLPSTTLILPSTKSSGLPERTYARA